MAEMSEAGKIGWIDITVDDAEGLGGFYSTVVGRKPQGVNMREYPDFNMTKPETGTPVAGIYHAKGGNAELPRQTLIYTVVADAEASAAACAANFGKVLVGPKDMGGSKYAVIEDPSDAVAALCQAP